MPRRFLFLLSLVFAATFMPLSSQAQPGPTKWKDNRIPFRLLPGYKITGYAGWEGDAHGKIWRDNGPTIEYGIDIYGGNAVDSIPKEQQLWREEQWVGVNHFVCVYTRSDELVVTVSERAIANFRAKIQSQKDLTEVLLTILTLEPEHGYAVDPSMIINDRQKLKH